MTTEERTPGTEERKVLERFVVENDDLLDLESRIGRFNIFDALGITWVEIRHSNFLAFILDPAESHGQGQVFLKALLMDLFRNAPPDFPCSPIDLDGTDLRGVEVKREWKSIDLLITCKEPRFAVAIENKVRSQEHSDQLARYKNALADSYAGLPVLHVYLTPDADEPSEESWIPYSYSRIHYVLSRVREAHKNAIGDDVRIFLDHYLSLLGTRFMDSKELDELCRRIYKNHRQALDLIWERVGSPDAAAFAEVLDVLEHDARWQILCRSSKYADIVPRSWLEWLPPFGLEDDAPLCVHIRWKATNLAYTIFVGPMQNAMQRERIVTKLREDAPSCGFKSSKAYQVQGKWNRITAIDRFLQWGEDDQPEPRWSAKARRRCLMTSIRN